jgi:biofilm protein TabA
MIYGNIQNLGDINVYPKVIYNALEYLKSKDFSIIEPGKYEIIGNDVFVSITDTKTDIVENKKAESHVKYMDIQFSPNGGEVMGFAVSNGNDKFIKNKF